MLKWQICYTEFTNLLQLTVSDPETSRSTSTNYAARVWKSCVVGLSWSSLGSSFQSASDQLLSFIHLSFAKSVLHPTPQTKIYRVRSQEGQKIGHHIQNDLSREQFRIRRMFVWPLFYSQWSILSATKILVFPP